ncbi:MAG: hypothetical protein V1874_11330 [Spirochaetota bacterium]
MVFIKEMYNAVKSVSAFLFDSLLFRHVRNNIKKKYARLIYKYMLSIVKLEHYLYELSLGKTTEFKGYEFTE